MLPITILPKFTDNKHGFIAVTYVDEKGDSKAAVVLFETADGGKSWKPIRSITNLFLPGIDRSYTVAVADSTLFVIAGSRDEKRTTLSKDGPDGRTDTDISSLVQTPGYEQLSFATPKQGWLLGKEMYSTSDGGSTWRAVAPPGDQISTTTLVVPVHYPIGLMQLLTPEVGWAFSPGFGSLFWTEDKGITWKEITPSHILFGDHRIFSTFFLDTKHGWALSRDAVFSTLDAGAHWSITNLDLSALQDPFGSIRVGQIAFADSLHGWVSFDIESRQGEHKNCLLTTSDGGRGWQPAPTDPGLAGSIRLLTSTEGWIRSPRGDVLLTTYDGGHSWERASLGPPKDASLDSATYDLPTFEDSNHGFLPVTYSGGLEKKALAALYATEDRGKTWKLDSTLTNLASMPVGSGISSTVVRSTWLAATALNDSPSFPIITPIASGGTLTAGYHSELGYYGARQMSFVTPSIGWVLVDENRLLATADGGGTGTSLSPGPSEQSFVPRPGRMPLQSTHVGSMQLLGSEVGVVTAAKTNPNGEDEFHLFRTENNGAHWKDISPLLTVADSTFSNYFFLDDKHGLLLLWKPKPTPVFELESTTDGGTTWSKADARIPQLEAFKDKILSQADIAFVDPLHGWLKMIVSSVGKIDTYWDTTADGGRTWKPGGISPVRPARIRFVTRTEAWFVSEPKTPTYRELKGHPIRQGGGMPVLTNAAGLEPVSNELYVTHDGGATWQNVSVETPKKVYSSEDASTYSPPSVIYELPTFVDGKRGLLPVTYTAVTGIGSSGSYSDHAVLFVTDDGGHTWRPDRMVFSEGGRNAPGCNPCTVYSTVKGSTWIVANHQSQSIPSLSTVNPGAEVNISPAPNSVDNRNENGAFWEAIAPRLQLDLVTPSSGWIVWNGQLLGTTNLGGSWTQITPVLNETALRAARP